MIDSSSLKRHLVAAVSMIMLAATWSSLASAADHTTLNIGGREVIVYVPGRMPAAGTRALVVVLHGGLGNATRIANAQSESGLNMDAVAERYGFVVAYLNGTPVTRRLGDRVLGWNAGGGCCGMSAENGIDDVAYLSGAVDDLVQRYGIDHTRVYGIGHSNGAMMTERLACETRLYAAVVAISGPLETDTSRCAAAQGARILAIHGADDRNVPLAGGVGPKGLSRVDFRSEEYARRVFTDSGASYTLQVLPDVDHSLDHIGAAIGKAEGITIAEKAARFFDLAHP